MNQFFLDTIKTATHAKSIQKLELIQQLWSGYGEILRYGLKGSEQHTVVVKNVRLPEDNYHPRGWNSNLSHERKVKSYQIEMNWYRQWSERCDDFCRIPHCLAMETQGDDVLLVLEDLNDSGFPERRTSVSMTELSACIKWLANFHACFLGESPKGLWPVGTYWHLETRPEELEVLSDKQLKNKASDIDRILSTAKYKTFVHGDAKLANFCFSPDGDKVAAVDFQYVGGGCGMKDLAYFVGSCLYEEDCERLESSILNLYFDELKLAIKRYQKDIDFAELESEWRYLYQFAWADFHRFLKGWSPGHWKINCYSEKTVKKVIKLLDKQGSVEK